MPKQNKGYQIALTVTGFTLIGIAITLYEYSNIPFVTWPLVGLSIGLLFAVLISQSS